MKKFKKVVVLVMVAAMVLTMFGGCGNKNNDTTADKKAAGTTETSKAATTAAEEDPLKDHLELSCALWGIGGAVDSGQEDAVKDKLFEKLNITIKPVNVTWDDYKQKVQIWAASSQLPDFFAVDAIGTENHKNWVEQGIVHAFPDDLSPYPEINKLMSSPGFDVYQYPMGDPNSKIYSLPRLNHRDIKEWCCDTGVMIRKDWMENVGITKLPENLDEFITLMKAFVEKDPDKNGKNDTIGLTTYNAEWLKFFFLSYEPGVTVGGWVRDQENPGKWIPTFMTKDFLEGLKAIKKMYDAGALDMDFATLKAEEGADKVAANKAGAYSHDISNSTLGWVGAKFEKVNPDKKFEDIVTVMKPFKHYKDGKYYMQIGNPAWSETYINAKCDDKKVDRILRLFNYALTDEGYNLLHLGIEGVDYKKEGNSIVLTPQKDSEGKEIAINTKYPITKIAFLAEWSGTHSFDNSIPTTNPKLRQMSIDMRDWYFANAVVPETDLRVGFIDVPSKAKGTANVNDIIIKCVLSDDVEKTWNEIVKSSRANGYDKLIEEINAECAKAGIK